MGTIERLTTDLVPKKRVFEEVSLVKKWKISPGDLHSAYLTFDRRRAIQVLDATDDAQDRIPAIGALAALHGLSSPGLFGWIKDLTTGIDAAKAEIESLFDDLKKARIQIETVFGDPVALLTKPLSRDRHDLESRLIQYLVGGKCPTRTGGSIDLPGSDSDDPTLTTVLGVLRILEEDLAESKWPGDLPWLADSKASEAQRQRKWEEKAGELADRVGAALGRSAAAGAQGLISPFLKLPDEAIKGIAAVAGVTARKAAEAEMHRYVVAHPELPPPAD